MNILTNWRLQCLRSAFLAGSVLFLTPTCVLQADCIPPASGLIAWWQGEGNTSDFLGGNNAALVNGATFSKGEVGQSFSFDGVQSYVQIADSPSLNLTNEFTIE